MNSTSAHQQTSEPSLVFLITKPVELYTQVAQSRGYNSLFVSPLEIEIGTFTLPSDSAPSPEGPCFLLSSQSAVDALVAQPWFQENPTGIAYCVGSATGQAALRAGLRLAAAVDGGGARFVDALRRGQITLPDDRQLHWVRPKRIAFELSKALRGEGVQVLDHLAYHTIKVSEPPAHLRSAINSEPDAPVALFSASGAETFAQWANALSWRPERLFLIGARLLESLENARWLEGFDGEIHVATQSSRDDFAKILGNL